VLNTAQLFVFSCLCYLQITLRGPNNKLQGILKAHLFAWRARTQISGLVLQKASMTCNFNRLGKFYCFKAAFTPLDINYQSHWLEVSAEHATNQNLRHYYLETRCLSTNRGQRLVRNSLKRNKLFPAHKQCDSSAYTLALYVQC
jgi:hypothetical protein